MTKEKLIQRLERRVRLAGSAQKVASALEIPNSHLSDVLRSRRDPGPKMLEKMGLRRVVSYEAVPK